MRFVETTLWANWFFVGGGYSSFTLLRNTTSTNVTVKIIVRRDTGEQAGALTNVVVPPSGTFYRDVRQIMGCGAPAARSATQGSVEVTHTGSPQAVVGSQTTLSAETALSLAALMFQRRPW